jgi:hypothetical protein
VQHLGAVADDAAAFLFDPGQEARDVDQGDERDVEDIAGADEARDLVGGVESSAPAMCIGWLATMPTTTPEMRAKPTMTLRAKVACTSKEFAVVDERRMTACMSIGSGNWPGSGR